LTLIILAAELAVLYAFWVVNSHQSPPNERRSDGRR